MKTKINAFVSIFRSYLKKYSKMNNYSPVLLRRLRNRRVFNHQGTRVVVHRKEQPTEYSLSVHVQRRKPRAKAANEAPIQRDRNNEAGPSGLNPPVDVHVKAKRAVVNRRAANAMRTGRVYPTINLDASSVPRPRKIKSKKHLSKCGWLSHTFFTY